MNNFSFKNWFIALEMRIGDAFKKQPWKISFSDVKYDPTEKYYVELKKVKSNIADINDVKIGDEVADLVMSNQVYWKVHGIDELQKRLYLDPIKNNPYKPNSSGQIVGAGGKVFGKHDFDVLSGEYENKRIDGLLDVINQKKYHDIKDVSYILLGTVPVQVGPNGSQGGWYSVNDYHNRGSQKGMKVVDIIKKDADTLKNKLGLDVPQGALNGTMNPHDWNNYVNGGWETGEKTKLDFEDFDDVNVMAKVILSHKQPQIRLRNTDALLSKARETDKYDELIRNVSFELAKQKNTDIEHFEPNWHVKEKFIDFAGRKGWDDVLIAFQNSLDRTNRRYVAWNMSQERHLPILMQMLSKEDHAEPFVKIGEQLWEIIMAGYKKLYSFGFSERLFKDYYNELPDEQKDVLKNRINSVFNIISNKGKLIDQDLYNDYDVIISRFNSVNKIINSK